MKLRDVAPLVLIFVLGGCSGADLDQAYNYVGIGGNDRQAAPPSEQADAGAVATPLPLPEDAAATRPWTPVGATPQPARTIAAAPVLPPPAVAAAPVPPRRTTAAAAAPPPPTAAATVSHRRTAAAAPMPARRPAAAPPVFAPPVVAAPTRSEPPPVFVATARPQTVVAAAAPPVAEPPPVAPAPDSWCSRIAKSASDDAASNGFDAATQRHRAEVSYNQCVRYGH